MQPMPTALPIPMKPNTKACATLPVVWNEGVLILRTTLILAALFLFSASLMAQQSGRHFRRTDRTPSTPVAAAQGQAADATARDSCTQRIQPLRRLRSGRAWSAYHFSRMPQSSPAPSCRSVTEASATKGATRKSLFWGRSLRG